MKLNIYAVSSKKNITLKIENNMNFSKFCFTYNDFKLCEINFNIIVNTYMSLENHQVFRDF